MAWLLVIALAAATNAVATPLTLPPKYLSPQQAEPYYGAHHLEPVFVSGADRVQHVAGFIISDVPGQYAGVYAWNARQGAYEEFLGTLGGRTVHGEVIPVAVSVAAAHRETLRTLILLVYANFAKDARAGQQGPTSRAQGGNDTVVRTSGAEMGSARAPTPTPAPMPIPERPAVPQPTYVRASFLESVLVDTSAHIATFWEQHRFVSIFIFVLAGCVFGACTGRRGPRPIEVRQDDVLAALAASERKLAASRTRLQQLSSLIDAEEARFVERVSAIVERR